MYIISISAGHDDDDRHDVCVTSLSVAIFLTAQFHSASQTERTCHGVVTARGECWGFKDHWCWGLKDHVELQHRFHGPRAHRPDESCIQAEAGDLG